MIDENGAPESLTSEQRQEALETLVVGTVTKCANYKQDPHWVKRVYGNDNLPFKHSYDSATLLVRKYYFGGTPDARVIPSRKFLEDYKFQQMIGAHMFTRSAYGPVEGIQYVDEVAYRSNIPSDAYQIDKKLSDSYTAWLKETEIDYPDFDTAEKGEYKNVNVALVARIMAVMQAVNAGTSEGDDEQNFELTADQKRAIDDFVVRLTPPNIDSSRYWQALRESGDSEVITVFSQEVLQQCREQGIYKPEDEVAFLTTAIQTVSYVRQIIAQPGEILRNAPFKNKYVIEGGKREIETDYSKLPIPEVVMAIFEQNLIDIIKTGEQDKGENAVPSDITSLKEQYIRLARHSLARKMFLRAQKMAEENSSVGLMSSYNLLQETLESDKVRDALVRLESQNSGTPTKVPYIKEVSLFNLQKKLLSMHLNTLKTQAAQLSAKVDSLTPEQKSELEMCEETITELGDLVSLATFMTTSFEEVSQFADTIEQSMRASPEDWGFRINQLPTSADSSIPTIHTLNNKIAKSGGRRTNRVFFTATRRREPNPRDRTL